MGANLRPRLTAVLRSLGHWGKRPKPIRFATLESIGRSLLPRFAEEVGYGRLVAERRWAESQVALANHFRRRIAPRFFMTPAEVATACAHVPGAWREQALAEAERWTFRVADASKWSELAEPSIDGTLQDQQHWLQAAVPLARAALYGQGTEATLHRLIRLWMQANEVDPCGGGYSHPLLAVYRSVSLSWALAYLQAAARNTHELECDLIRVLLTDGDYIRSRFGTSFPNNHLLADGFGLWYLGTLLPEFASASEWRRMGEALWLQELERQVHEDGSSFEHSVHYQEFACEMGTLYWVLSGRNGDTAPPWAGARVRSMLHFLVALGGVACRPPPLGDCVEGVLIPLDSVPRSDTAVYAELEAALFGSPGEARPDHESSERAFWLLARTPATITPAAGPGLESFPEGGVHIFSEADRTSRLVFRTGPLPGSAVNPGHMHADLLSIFLDVAGEPLVVEAGTFTYRSGRRSDGVDWRSYFLGPASHNSLLIDGSDPLARGTGDFPSGQPLSFVAQTGFHVDDQLAWVEGENTGTTSYAGHRRGVIHVRGRFWLVYDKLPKGLSLATASMGLQLSHAVEAEVLPKGIRIANGRAGCWCVPDESFGPVVSRCGEIDPPAGWVSTRYGQIAPAPQLRFGPARSAPLHAFLLQPMHTANEKPPILIARQRAGGQVAMLVAESGGRETQVTLGNGRVAIDLTV